MESGTVADKWTLTGVSRDDDRGVTRGSLPDSAPAAEPREAAKAALAPEDGAPRRPRTSLLSMAVGVIGMVALGASAWVYAETQREIKRVSTDIAQIRVSLELFNRQQASGGPAGESSDAALQALANRLALLEADQRRAAVAPAAPVAAAPSAGETAASGDCLPLGMRFMMAAGDSYAVCGTTGTVAVAAVDNGYVTLSDGTVVAQGATVLLPDTKCMLGVMPTEGDGLSGYAEVRVTC